MNVNSHRKESIHKSFFPLSVLLFVNSYLIRFLIVPAKLYVVVEPVRTTIQTILYVILAICITEVILFVRSICLTKKRFVHVGTIFRKVSEQGFTKVEATCSFIEVESLRVLGGVPVCRAFVVVTPLSGPVGRGLGPLEDVRRSSQSDETHSRTTAVRYFSCVGMIGLSDSDLMYSRSVLAESDSFSLGFVKVRVNNFCLFFGLFLTPGVIQTSGVNECAGTHKDQVTGTTGRRPQPDRRCRGGSTMSVGLGRNRLGGGRDIVQLIKGTVLSTDGSWNGSSS